MKAIFKETLSTLFSILCLNSSFCWGMDLSEETQSVRSPVPMEIEESSFKNPRSSFAPYFLQSNTRYDFLALINLKAQEMDSPLSPQQMVSFSLGLASTLEPLTDISSPALNSHWKNLDSIERNKIILREGFMALGKPERSSDRNSMVLLESLMLQTGKGLYVNSNLWAQLRSSTELRQIASKLPVAWINESSNFSYLLRYFPSLSVLSLKHIDFDDRKFYQFSEFVKIVPALWQLTSLNLKKCKLSGISAMMLLGVLEENQTLTRLKLNNNRISDPVSKAIKNFLYRNKTLTYLDLRNNYLQKAAIAIGSALNVNTTLRSLYLNHNDLCYQGCQDIAKALETNSTLTSLKLSHAFLGHDGGVAFGRALKVNRALTELYLRETQLGSTGIQAISEGLAENTTLLTLDIQEIDALTQGGKAMGEALRTNRTLQTLLMGHALIQTASSFFAEGLKANNALVRLNLASNSIGTEGAICILEALKSNFTLRFLNLSYNVIKPGVGVILREVLSANKTLEQLILNCNQLGCAGTLELAQGLKVNLGLRYLDLSENCIELEGAKALEDALDVNTSLGALDASGNRFQLDAHPLHQKFKARLVFSSHWGEILG